MRTGTPGFTGARLREAREARGLSAATLAEVVGVSRQVVSQYENSDASPHPEKLFRIAGCLNMPVAFFTQPAREYAASRVFYRSRSAATKGARMRAERRLDWLRDLVALLRQYVQFPRVDLPRADVGSVRRPVPVGLIEDAASATRQALQLGEEPAPNIVWLLENHGVVVTRGILDTASIDAFSALFSSEHAPFVFLGADKDSAVRSRFDAAHELGHLVIHHNVLARDLGSPSELSQIEKEADAFASAFLLPARAFAEDLFTPSLDRMLGLKGRWLASVAAMIMRARSLEMLSDEQARRLWIARARRGWTRREPLDDQLEIEQPRLLARSLELLFDQGIRTPQQVLDDLSLSSGDVQALAGLPDDWLGDEPPIQLLRAPAPSYD